MINIATISDDEPAALKQAIAVLAAGDVIAMPTETVYGLAGDATNGLAVARIFAVKGRPHFNPLICHMADLEMARAHVRFDPLSEQLAAAFWPGALTLVLPLRPDSPVATLATAGLDTLAVRVPVGFAARLIARFGAPLAAPSANTSGTISPTRARHVAHDLAEKVSLILDGGPASIGLESTIVKIADGEATLLRPGGIPAAAIETVIGKPLVRRAHAGAIEAPGMLASHYAPATRLRIGANSVSSGEVLINFAGRTLAGMDKAAAVLELSAGGDLTEAAAALFDTMKKADRYGAAGIAVAPIPSDGLGEAINDRLKRAAAPRDS